MVRLYFLFLIFFKVALFAGLAQAAEGAQFPKFRHVDAALVAAPEGLPPRLTLLTDQAFAPFSFDAVSGVPSGISVELGLSACVQLKISCTIKSMAFADLKPSLQQKQGDIILAGPSAAAIQVGGLVSTKSYFYSFGRFIARGGSNVSSVSPKTLTGLRVGFVKETRHAKFLSQHYAGALLMPFASQDVLLEALRTGQLELGFVDATQAAFLLKGTASRGCCTFVGGAIVDFGGLTQGLAMATRAEDIALRDAFDIALDRLQENGESAKIFAKYLPLSPF